MGGGEGGRGGEQGHQARYRPQQHCPTTAKTHSTLGGTNLPITRAGWKSPPLWVPSPSQPHGRRACRACAREEEARRSGSPTQAPLPAARPPISLPVSLWLLLRGVCGSSGFPSSRLNRSPPSLSLWLILPGSMAMLPNPPLAVVAAGAAASVTSSAPAMAAAAKPRRCFAAPSVAVGR